MAGVIASKSDDWLFCASSAPLMFEALVFLGSEVEAYRRVKLAVEDLRETDILARAAYDGWGTAVFWREGIDTEGTRKDSKGGVRDRKRESPKRRSSIIILG